MAGAVADAVAAPVEGGERHDDEVGADDRRAGAGLDRSRSRRRSAYRPSSKRRKTGAALDHRQGEATPRPRRAASAGAGRPRCASARTATPGRAAISGAECGAMRRRKSRRADRLPRIAPREGAARGGLLVRRRRTFEARMMTTMRKERAGPRGRWSVDPGKPTA